MSRSFNRKDLIVPNAEFLAGMEEADRASALLYRDGPFLDLHRDGLVQHLEVRRFCYL